MFNFSSGLLFVEPNAGNPSANPTPKRVLTLQDVDIEISQQLVELKGALKFPDDVAPGDMKITGKFSTGRLDYDMFNDIFFADTVDNGIKSSVGPEATVVPSGVVTPPGWVANHAYSLNDTITDGTDVQIVVQAGTSETPTAPAWNATLGGLTPDGTVVWKNLGVPGVTYQVTFHSVFYRDLGVYFVNGGLALKRVTSGTPTTGQYKVSGGTYTFAAADNGLAVAISYMVTDTKGFTISVHNQLMGYGPVFELWVAEPYNFVASATTGLNLAGGIHLFACRLSKLGHKMKRDGYTIPEMDFTAYANPSGQVAELFKVAP